jgi:hypothetical protein
MIVHGGITPSKRWRSDPQIAHAVTLKMTSASFDNQYPRPNYSRWCHHPRRHARSRDTGSKHTGAVSFPLRTCRLNGTRELANYLAFVQLASIRLWLRVNESTAVHSPSDR